MRNKAEIPGSGTHDCVEPESRDWRLSLFWDPDMFPYKKLLSQYNEPITSKKVRRFAASRWQAITIRKNLSVSSNVRSATMWRPEPHRRTGVPGKRTWAVFWLARGGGCTNDEVLSWRVGVPPRG